VKLIIHKAGDPTRENVTRNAHAAIDALDPRKAHRVEIVEYKAPRTQDANAYLWSVPYPLLVRELGHATETWHEYFCGEWFGWRERELPGGRFEKTPVRTTTTNEEGRRDVVPGDVFWNFVENVRRFAAEAGVYVPEPDPFWKEGRKV